MAGADPILVSAIVPVYNGAHCLARCLDSLRKQTHPRVEIIVVLTPRIIGEPKLGDEGAAFADQYAQRQAG